MVAFHCQRLEVGLCTACLLADEGNQVGFVDERDLSLQHCVANIAHEFVSVLVVELDFVVDDNDSPHSFKVL